MTYRMVHDTIAKETKNEFDIVSNPEFLAEGRAVKDCLIPSRIVIGTSNAKAASIMEELLRAVQIQGSFNIVHEQH